MSSSKRTKHINNRCFFITDRQSKGELKVIYCPTDEMIADYHTKPLQGEKFYKFRKMILGLWIMNIDRTQECVWDQTIMMHLLRKITAAS